MDKEINATARKLRIRVRKVGESWFWKTTRTGDGDQTLRWLRRCAVRRGVLPPAVLPEDDGIRIFTEFNGPDPDHRIL